MDAEGWKNRIIAIGRAYLAGDSEPLEITCEKIAAMEKIVANSPAIVVPHMPETPLFPEDHQTSEV